MTIAGLALLASFATAACTPTQQTSINAPIPVANQTTPDRARTLHPGYAPSQANRTLPHEFDVSQRIAQAVQAVMVGSQARINLVLHAPARHLHVEVGPSVPVRTASVIKLLILQARLAAGPLTHADQEAVRAMITRSDNDATTTLWTQAGRTEAIAAAAAADGMTATTPIPVMLEPWDGWQTTAADQVRVLDNLVGASGTQPNRQTLELMTQVEPDQAWGVGQAGTQTEQVAVKNGWLPITPTNWIINSDGCIAPLSTTPVCMAITSTGSPTMQAGIHAVTAAARAAIDAMQSPSTTPAATGR